MTKPGDSAQQISQQILGYDDPNYTKMLCLINEANSFSDYQAIILPESKDQALQQRCAQVLSQLTITHRYQLQQLQAHHVNPNILLSLSLLLHSTNLSNQSNKLAMGFTVAQILEGVAHHHHKNLNHFKALMDKTFHSLRRMAHADSHQLRHEAHTVYSGLRDELQINFKNEFKRFLGGFEHLFHENGWHSIRLHRKLGWHFSHELVAHDITRIMEFVKQIGDGLFVLDITGALIEAGVTIAEHKSWFTKLTHECVDVESFFAASLFIDMSCVLIGLTPLGWMGIIGAGVVTFGLHHYLMKKALNPYLNYINRTY